MDSNDTGALRRLIYTSRANDHDLVDILRVAAIQTSMS